MITDNLTVPKSKEGGSAVIAEEEDVVQGKCYQTDGVLSYLVQNN